MSVCYLFASLAVLLSSLRVLKLGGLALQCLQPSYSFSGVIGATAAVVCVARVSELNALSA